VKASYFIIALFFVLSVFTVFELSDKGVETIDPQPIIPPVMIRHESAPAMTSIAAMYAPAENKKHWIKLVCSGMTEGGCNYFKSNLADEMWESQSGHDASGGNLENDVTAIDETTQVWKANLSIFKNHKETVSDVYLLVRHSSDGFWYLDRVLYGPGVAQ
jgi:hypothetical protein